MNTTEPINSAPSSAADKAALRMRSRRVELKKKNICPVCGKRCLVCGVKHPARFTEHYPENMPKDAPKPLSTCPSCSLQAKERARNWHSKTRDYVGDVRIPRICDQLRAILAELIEPVTVVEYIRQDKLLFLTPREREVLRLRHSKEHPTLETLSDVYGVSKQRIQKIEAVALKKCVAANVPEEQQAANA